ncbi:hypothetical protein [Agrobacterium sp.]|jgi:hypothetical protein|uniref:hypothetical protein n=1 Tax=Agrobacterium sp. TaxID=361 RepID=UPI0028A7C00E|nr:hypothetical protein [Agrobacterium sp.]
MPEKISPAVASLRKEQTNHKRTSKDDLEEGVEATFPASDPVSTTQTAVPTGRADVDAAEDLSEKKPDKKKSV